MSLFALVPLPYRILAFVGLFAAAVLFGFVGGVHHEEASEAKREIARQQADLKAMAAAAVKTKSLQKAKDDALTAANERAKIAEAAASAAHATGDSLRHDLSDANRVSSASIASLRAYTTTLRATFGECTQAVERLAKAAGSYASDSLTLQQAWPR